MQDYSNTIRNYMEANGLSQEALAKKANVSQATVSRALSKKPAQHGNSRQKLYKYISRSTVNAEPGSNSAAEKVLNAFIQVWDKTDMHADAIARVILSLSGLKPSKRYKKR